MKKEVQEKIVQLQTMEAQLNNIVMQRQTFQSQLYEVENALIEMGDASETYRVVGPLMVASDKPKLEADLKDKKKLLEARSNSLEKEEVGLKERFEKLQTEVMKEIEDEKSTKK